LGQGRPRREPRGRCRARGSNGCYGSWWYLLRIDAKRFVKGSEPVQPAKFASLYSLRSGPRRRPSCRAKSARLRVRQDIRGADRTMRSNQRRLAPFFAVCLALTLVLALAPILVNSASPSDVNLAPSIMEPPTTGGAAVVDRALAKLSTAKRLLVIAAHPDDEDTSLLTLVSRGMGGEAAYMALSRGEGGQNLIGPELGQGLGLIRSRELLAARGVDGGRQFFSRAYDFGYTTSLDETLTLWPKDALVEDAVRIIRRFKPQVIVSIFPGVPIQTHGQHQAAGLTAFTAFPLAGDPQALPQLAAEGLTPWKPQALYRSSFFDRKAATATLSLNGVDPFAGKSVFQLAMA